MKVTIVNPPLIGHEERGTGVYTKNLISALSNLSGIEVVPSELNSLPTGMDIYHFPYFDPFFLTFPRLPHRRCVVTIHDLIPVKFADHFPRGVRGELKWQVQKRNAKAATAIITDSIASKTDVIEYIGIQSDRIFPVYLAPAPIFSDNIDTHEKHRIREQYHLPQKFVLYVGDMNWNKNVPNIIHAATEANVPLVIVSKPFTMRQVDYNPWKDSLIEAQRLAKESNLIYGLGRVSSEDLVSLYHLATALVFPSYYEGFGLPVVEAFQAGCPVITSRCGSLGEIAGDAALFVSPSDIDEISRAIRILMTDEHKRRILIQKGKHQAQKFNWGRTARATKSVYTQIMEQPI